MFHARSSFLLLTKLIEVMDEGITDTQRLTSAAARPLVGMFRLTMR